MKQIPGVDLKQLVEETSTELLVERRRGIGGKIKAMIIKVEDLTQRKARLTSELNKVTDSLEKATELIEKLKAGDWSVIQEDKEQKDPAPQA